MAGLRWRLWPCDHTCSSPALQSTTGSRPLLPPVPSARGAAGTLLLPPGLLWPLLLRDHTFSSVYAGPSAAWGAPLSTEDSLRARLGPKCPPTA